MAEAPDLRIHGLTVRYGSFTALADVTADLNVGVTGLLGANGAGKTTLMRTLAGILTAQQGNVIWQGGESSYRCGYMPQEAPRTALLTSRDYVRYLALLTGVARREVTDRVALALEATGLTEKAKTRVSRLSGGMFRRLMLAAALVGEPDVLLLDEPTVGLDPIQREEMLAVLRRVGENKAVVLSSHLLDDVADVADSLLILREGRVAFQGPIGELTETPGDLRARVVDLMRSGGAA
ncbi:MAG: ABC transporter ATP-binding protein [Sporichthyaceae bacterium]